MLGFTSAALMVTAAALASSPAHGAEGEIRGAGAKDAVQGSYIVVLKEGASTSSVSKKYGGKITHTYKAALKGYAAKMSEAGARRTAADPAVDYVEQDRVVWALDTQSPVPSWGLDRIDQRDLPLDNSYTYPNTATNVTAYVIDTGVAFDHPDFGGRATSGRDTVDNDNDATDCHGHGTHVAGTIGGTAHGLAKEVKIVGVRVLNCEGGGTTAQVVAGVDWVTANAQKPAVANMSLGGMPDAALDAAVQESIASGVTYAIASGNGDNDACDYSPARVPEAITVNATDDTDARTYFSNYGSCTDIFAPGLDITSAWLNGGTNTISGTSMATPHVAGAAALYLSANPSASPAQVQQALKDNATKNKVTDPGSGSPNNLLFVGSGGPPPPPPPPQAVFTSGSEDGYVKAYSDGSGAVVGTNKSTLGLGIGRGIDGKHNRTVLSFDTSSLPDGATITRAYVTVTRKSSSGDPWANPAGNQLVIDVKTGCFGAGCATGTDDWSAAATQSSVGNIAKWTSGSTNSTDLNQAGLAAINKTGTTQLKLRFSLFQTSTAYVIIAHGADAKLTVEYALP
ncbi:MAG: S8 family peptidase [Micromonosporaceae bacterium]